MGYSPLDRKELDMAERLHFTSMYIYIQNLAFLPGEAPWIEVPGGLQSTGSQRAGHDRGSKPSTAQVRPRRTVLMNPSMGLGQRHGRTEQTCHTVTGRERGAT